MKKELVEQGLILEIKSGSHLYHLNTEKSDVDYMGVFFAPKDYVYGLKTVEQVDMSVVDKLENGRNSKDAIDKVFYEARRFFTLCLDSNPNIIEALFVGEENIINISPFGRKLLDNKHLFVSEKIIPKFIGYSISQKRKLMVKTSNMKDLVEGLKVLKSYMEEGFIKETLPELIGRSEFDKYFKEKSNKVTLQVGAYQINRNITIKSAVKQLEEIIKNTSHRIDTILCNGYETKFASHYLRLIYQTIELLETGTLKFPSTRRDLLLDIKTGKVSYEDFLKLSDEAEKELEIAKTRSVLPKLPNYNAVEKLLIEGYEEYLNGHENE